MSDRTYHSGVGTENGAAEELDALWRQFGKAASEKEFCMAWLALQCSAIPGVASAVVVLDSTEEGRSYVMAASWPEGQGDFKHLAEVAERSLKEKRGLALRRSSSTDGARASYDLAYPVNVAGRIYGVVALDIEARGDAALRDDSATCCPSCHLRRSNDPGWDSASRHPAGIDSTRRGGRCCCRKGN